MDDMIKFDFPKPIKPMDEQKVAEWLKRTEEALKKKGLDRPGRM
jgi:hypothetical protein